MRKAIADAKLARIEERVRHAEGYKIGLIYATHGTLLMQFMLKGKLNQDLLFSATGPIQGAAAHLLQSADPETIKELLRGYRLAKQAKLV